MRLRSIKQYLLFILSSILVITCGEDPVPSEEVPEIPAPRAPEAFSLTLPKDSATIVNTVTLQWDKTFNNLAEDILYDVYLGKDNPPPKYKGDLTETTLDIEKSALNKGERYYWKVVARTPDNQESETSTRTFKTLPAVAGFEWLDERALTGEYTDSRDGKKYRVIRQGNKIWMQTNFAYLKDGWVSDSMTVYNYSGSDITGVKNQEVTLQNLKEKLSWNDDTKTVKAYDYYGVMYSYKGLQKTSNEVFQVLPTGWKIPQKVDLYKYLASIGGGLTSTAVNSISELEDLLSSSLGGGSGGSLKDSLIYFNLYGGKRSSGGFEGLGEKGYYWSIDTNRVIYQGISFNYDKSPLTATISQHLDTATVAAYLIPYYEIDESLGYSKVGGTDALNELLEGLEL